MMATTDQEPAAVIAPARFWYIDAVKIAAIAAVAAIHIFGVKALAESDGGVGWWLSNVAYSGSRWAVPVFVMASGALVLGSAGRNVPSVYRRRFGRVVPAAIFWTAVYLAFSARFQGGTKDPRELASLVASGRPYNHLYFLAVILGLYLVAPFLSRAFAGASSRWIWGAALVAIGFNVADPLLSIVGGSGSSPNLATWWIQFVGYFLLGHAIHLAGPRIDWRPLLLAFIAAVVIQVVGVIWGRSHAPFIGAYLEGYLALPVVIAAVALYALARGADTRMGPRHSLLERLAVLTFGVYLIHLLIASILLGFWHVPPEASFLVYALVWIATLVLAFVATAVIIRLPVARRVMGV